MTTFAGSLEPSFKTKYFIVLGPDEWHEHEGKHFAVNIPGVVEDRVCLVDAGSGQEWRGWEYIGKHHDNFDGECIHSRRKLRTGKIRRILELYLPTQWSFNYPNQICLLTK